jgi:hypothetical protein
MEIDQLNLTLELESLRKENQDLKDKMKELRLENNSFLYSALVKAQSELPIVGKNQSAYGKQRYADLAEIVRVSRPILVKNGLCVIQSFEGDMLITILAHSSGQSIKSSLKLPTSKEDKPGVNILHTWGGSITYARRYAYSAIINIVSDDDTDGN